MSNFIMLKRDNINESVFINADHISSMTRVANYTAIRVNEGAGPTVINVSETPNEILHLVDPTKWA